MNYILKKNYRIIVDGNYILDSMTLYINNLCRLYMKSIESIRSSIKKNLNINKYVPLYINDKLLLLTNKKIDTDGSIYFNYFEMKYYISIGKTTTIYFKDGSHIKTDISSYLIKTIINRAKKVLEYVSLN